MFYNIYTLVTNIFIPTEDERKLNAEILTPKNIAEEMIDKFIELNKDFF